MMTDRLITWVTALWFFMLAIIGLYAAGAILAGDHPLSGIDYARLLSKACMASFFTMMGHLTLARSGPIAQARGWQPRLSAFIGTNILFFSLLFLKPRSDLSIECHVLSGALILAGNLGCVYVLSHLGRSFSIMAEARRVVLGGPYRLVRHPLYLAEFVGIVGTVMQYGLDAWLLTLAQFSFQIVRMMNEERVLSRTFPEYAAYMARTDRLIPGVW